MAATLYWIGGTGIVNDTAHWSLTSDGSTAGVLPASDRDVIFDANSFSANGQTVTVPGDGDNLSCKNLSFAAINKTINVNLEIGSSTPGYIGANGDITLSDKVTFNASANSAIIIYGSSCTLTSGGCVLPIIDVNYDCEDLELADDLSCTGLLGTLSSAAGDAVINTHGYSITATYGIGFEIGEHNLLFACGTSVSTLTVGGIIFVESGAGRVTLGVGNVNLVVTPAPASAPSAVIFKMEAAALFYNIVVLASDAQFYGYMEVNNGFYADGTKGSLITLGYAESIGSMPYWIIQKDVGMVSITYCELIKSAAVGNALFLSLITKGCMDGGGNSGWIFLQYSGNIVYGGGGGGGGGAPGYASGDRVSITAVYLATVLGEFPL